MIETSSERLQQLKKSALEELQVAVVEAETAATDILPRYMRRALAAAITSEEFVRAALVGRAVTQQKRWKELVDEATRWPRTLGFVRVSEGTESLALSLGVGDQSTWSRTLNKWSTTEPPLVVCGSAIKGRGRPELEMVQIPLLTDWLLWVAQTNSIRINPKGRDYLWESHIRDLPVLAIRQLCPPGSPELSRNQADRFIDDLKHGPRSVRRLLHWGHTPPRGGGAYSL